MGRASEWGDIIAPPTFPVTFRDENADTGSMLRDLGVDISRILHGDEKAGRSGPMAFVVREMAVTDGENEIVCRVRHITVVRL